MLNDEVQLKIKRHFVFGLEGLCRIGGARFLEFVPRFYSLRSDLYAQFPDTGSPSRFPSQPTVKSRPRRIQLGTEHLSLLGHNRDGIHMKVCACSKRGLTVGWSET